MAIWLLISAAYPVFLIGMIVKAVRHWRRLKSRPSPAAREAVRAGDWVATR